MTDQALENAAAASVAAHSKDAPHPTATNADDAAGSIRQTVGQLADDVRATASKAGTAAADVARAAGAAAGRTGEMLQGRGAQAAAYAGDVTRSEPLLMLLGVGLVGFLLGVSVGPLSGRRSR